MAEPSGEDQPSVTVTPNQGRGEPAGVGNPESEEFSRFGTYIGRSALPGDREALLSSARDFDAPDDVIARLQRLPENTTFHTIAEVWRAGRTG